MAYSVRGFNILATATATLMLVVGCFELMFRVGRFDPGNMMTLLRIFPPICTLAAGAILFHPRMRNAVRAVGMVAVGLAAGRLFVSMYFIYNNISPSPGTIIEDSAEIVLMIFGYVMLALAAYQLYTGSHYIRGEAHSATTMRFTAALTIIMYLLALAYIDRYFTSATNMWNIYRDMITTPILYTMYFTMLCSREVFDAMPEEVMRRDLEDIGGRHEPGRLYADAEDMERFARRMSDPGSWGAPAFDCPVEAETVLPARGDQYRYGVMCQKWRGSDRIHVTLIPDGGRSFVSAVRFELESLDLSDGVLELRDGIGARLRVVAEPRPQEEGSA